MGLGSGASESLETGTIATGDPVLGAIVGGGDIEEDLKFALDPANFLGALTGSTGAKAAQEAASITNEELIRQFNLQQENLSPFLQAAQRQLPGIEQQLSPTGFRATLGALTPQVSSFLDPVQANKQAAAQRQLELSGLGGMGGAATEAGQIDEQLFNQLLLGAESDLFDRRIAISGIGEGAGTVLSTLGQRTGEGISQANIQADLAAQQARAQGTSNVAGLAGLATSIFSDERLKENIEEIGEYKGLRVIRWNWRDFVPESWKGINFGFSAQDVLDKYPQFVNENRGFLSIDKDRLLHHLEAI